MLYLPTRLKISSKNTNDRETVNSLQLENQWLRDRSDDAYGAYLLISVWNLLEKAWFKKCAQKRNFHDKILWHIVLICTRRFWWLATHQPLSSQNTPSLEYKVDEQPPTWPILCRQYYKGGEPYKMQIQVTKSKLTKFWPSRVLCAPSGMCMFLQFVQEYVLHL